jgi:hypothetical protein
MNLNSSPNKTQLSSLLASCNDLAGNHLLWVDKSGDVHLSQIPQGLTPAAFEETRPNMQLRYEVFQKGNEYVGPQAANDAEWVSQLFEKLMQEWPKARRNNKLELIELS